MTGLAFPALGLTGDAYVAITGGRSLLTTVALFHGIAAAGTHFAMLGGVDNSILGGLVFHFNIF